MLKLNSFECDLEVEPLDLTTDFLNNLQTLYAQ